MPTGTATAPASVNICAPNAGRKNQPPATPTPSPSATNGAAFSWTARNLMLTTKGRKFPSGRFLSATTTANPSARYIACTISNRRSYWPTAWPKTVTLNSSTKPCRLESTPHHEFQSSRSNPHQYCPPALVPLCIFFHQIAFETDAFRMSGMLELSLYKLSYASTNSVIKSICSAMTPVELRR